MMPTHLLLEGAVFEDRTLILELQQANKDLEQVNKDLRRSLVVANGEVASAKREASQAVAALRKQLSPLYQALQLVFGEMARVGGEDELTPTSARVSAVWDSWKQKLPGNPAKVIDALLLHGEMNNTQIGIAIGIRRSNVPQLIFKLNQAGLINKNGTKYSLKQL